MFEQFFLLWGSLVLQNGVVWLIETHLNIQHNSQISDECQTQSARVSTLSRERAHQENSNDSPQPIGFKSVLWIKACPQVYSNPQKENPDLKLTCRLWGIV